MYSEAKKPVIQKRNLVTAIPGPKSAELIKRRGEAVSASLGTAFPVFIDHAAGAIIVDVDANGQFIGLTNEPVWAAEFCDELGMLDHQALINFQNFNFAGMVIRKSVIEEFFGVKGNIKLTFMYEFLLRMTHFDTKIMIIPKIGYKHTNQRENSLFFNYKQAMNPTEAKWWLAQAKKEFYFTHDNRALEYAEPTEQV